MRAEDRDPDAYNENFAPLTRLLTTAFECLGERNVDAARAVSMRWDSEPRSLLLRLAAFARWHPEITVRAGMRSVRFSWPFRSNHFGFGIITQRLPRASATLERYKRRCSSRSRTSIGPGTRRGRASPASTPRRARSPS